MRNEYLLIVIAALNAVTALMQWLARRDRKELRQEVQATHEQVQTVQEHVQNVKEKVDTIEVHTNSMQDEMLKNAKELGKQEGKIEVLKEIIPNDTVPPSGKSA